MATYRADVSYIEDSEPGLIERNAAEFSRMGTLLESVEPTINRASHIEWESVAREKFDLRLKDAKSLIENLGFGFRRAGYALMAYSDEVENAKRQVSIGLEASANLRKALDAPSFRRLLAFVRSPLSMSYDDPMKQYEKVGAADFRWSVSYQDGLPRVDLLLTGAKRFYDQADAAFREALAIEEPAREDCVAKLGAARAALPELATLPGRDFGAAHDMAAGIEALQAELAQARADANVALPGGGLREEAWPTDPDGVVSAKLDEINRLAAGHQEASESYWDTGGFPWLEAEWVRDNEALIADIAARAGIPPDMLVAILLQEDNDGFFNDLVEQARARDLYSGDRDETSFGPMEIQIRRAADVLGYDPAALTDAQRDEVRAALEDPVRSLYIGAEYLERLKAGSDFADVPAAEMTDEHYRELAQMYNGGPYWEGSDAKAYGHGFMKDSLPAARDALR